jgi:hypothetical protein
VVGVWCLGLSIWWRGAEKRRRTEYTRGVPLRGPSGNLPRERRNTSGWGEVALLGIEGGGLAAGASHPLLRAGELPIADRKCRSLCEWQLLKAPRTPCGPTPQYQMLCCYYTPGNTRRATGPHLRPPHPHPHPHPTPQPRPLQSQIGIKSTDTVQPPPPACWIAAGGLTRTVAALARPSPEREHLSSAISITCES